MTTEEQIELTIDVVKILDSKSLIDSNALNALLPLGDKSTKRDQLLFLSKMLFRQSNNDDLGDISTEVRNTIYDKYLMRKGVQ